MLRLILIWGVFVCIILFSYFSTELDPITASNYQRIAFYDISRTIVNATISKRETERQTDRDRGGVEATFRSFPGITPLITYMYVCIYQIAG